MANSNFNTNVKIGFMVLMACLGFGLAINAVVNPTAENKAASKKPAVTGMRGTQSGNVLANEVDNKM